MQSFLTSVPKIDPDALVGQIEAAQFLNVSVPTVALLIQQANLPHSRIGRMWRFSRAALIEWKRTSGNVEIKWPPKKKPEVTADPSGEPEPKTKPAGKSKRRRKAITH